MTQSDIINNNFSKAFECIKCSNAYDTGEVLSEEKLFKQISERKHSTFDRSKFTVVGNPTITDDGVASGFSRANYLQKLSILPTEAGHRYIFKTRYKHITNNFSATGYMFNIVTTAGNYFGAVARLQPKTISFVNTITGTSIVSDFNALIEGETYDIEYHTDFSTYVKYYIDGDLKQSLTYSATGYPTTGNVLVGVSVNAEMPLTMGSVDLSQFSITVDGKEVFSGNKTGIDNIKPDNYEVVGSPVISNDWVLSNCTFNADYVSSKQTFNLYNANTWEIQCHYNPMGLSNKPEYFMFYSPTIKSNGLHLGYRTKSTLQLAVFENGNNVILSNPNIPLNWESYTDYLFKVRFTGTQYLLDYSKDNGNTWIKLLTVNSNKKTVSSPVYVRNGIYGGTGIDYGIKIGITDLNKTKVYIDGNLVYQPCLKIPYTESKTGSKIVDVAYRDRVIDLYEQEGQAGYYTIDEPNKNFTLPMGETYGMIEDTRASIPTKTSQLKNDSGFINNDSTFVHKTGNETVGGVKTFSSNPIITGTGININNSNDVVIQKQGTNFLRKASNGGLVLSGTNTIYLRPSGDTNTTNQLSVAKDGTVTGTKFVGSLKGNVTGNVSGSSGSCTGNSATATKATQDSSGNQINTSYQPLKYSKYSISTYASSHPYIKLATFTVSNTQNYDNSILFWVEILTAGVAKAYALCKLSARWGGNVYGGTSFEILEKYGDSDYFKLFDTLTWAYKYTTASSKGSIVGEIWMSIHPANYITYYFRPTECNEYGDYSMTPVTMASNPWTYYNKGGTSTSIASTAITSGYTQVKITDKSIRYYEPLLSHRWSDHLLNDMSWLRADTFSWQSGTTYSLVYNELLSEYNNSASTAKTEGSITFKRTPKGYKIALANQETAILNKYNSDGIAWYYILDTANKRFKLPRTKFGFEGIRTSVGDDIVAGAPNITGNITNVIYGGTNETSAENANPQGSLVYRGDLRIGSYHAAAGAGSNLGNYGLELDASLSNPIYGNSDTVQPPATQMYLYFYVGGFTKSAEAQTAGLKAELLNGKADVSTPSIQAPYLKNTYVNGTSGYRIWSDGYCEQWGFLNEANVIVTLLKKYKDTNYEIYCQWCGGKNTNFYSSDQYINNITSGGFQTNGISNNNVKQRSWRTCGYLAQGEY